MQSLGALTLQVLKHLCLNFCLRGGKELQLELWVHVFKGFPHEFTPISSVLIKPIVIFGISEVKNLTRWTEQPKRILMV